MPDLTYFMLTKDDKDLGAPTFPLIPGYWLDVWSLRKNWINSNPSFETDLLGWSATYSYFPPSGDEGTPTTAPSLSRVTTDAAPDAGGSACAQITNNDAQVDFLILRRTTRLAVRAGQTWTHSAFVEGQTTSNRQVGIEVEYFNSSGTSLSIGTAGLLSSTGGWQRVSRTEVVPANAVEASVRLLYRRQSSDPGTGLSVGEWARFDGAMSDLGSTLRPYTEDDDELTVDGDPAALDLAFRVGDSGHWSGLPTGFRRSAFIVVRDPQQTTDDSADPLATQVYRHAGLMCGMLAARWYEDGTLTWPAPSGYKVLQVYGYATDLKRSGIGSSAGWYAFQGFDTLETGTIRQMLSGSEDSTHKVAAILDLLAATTSTQRNTIATSYNSSSAAIGTALANLSAACGPNGARPDDTTSEPARQFNHRMVLNVPLANAAIGGGTPGVAAQYAMWAITAKEAGLIGATFTTANYNTMVAPIKAAVTLPSGY